MRVGANSRSSNPPTSSNVTLVFTPSGSASASAGYGTSEYCLNGMQRWVTHLRHRSYPSWKGYQRRDHQEACPQLAWLRIQRGSDHLQLRMAVFWASSLDCPSPFETFREALIMGRKKAIPNRRCSCPSIGQAQHLMHSIRDREPS